MPRLPRIQADQLFVLGVGGGVVLTLVISLAVWFFIGRTDINANLAPSPTEATPTPTLPTSPVEHGVYDDHIEFGQSAAFDGPAQELGKNMWLGIQAAFQEANRAGGVHGRALHLNVRDDGYEPERAIANTQELIDQESVFALIGAVGTPTSRSAVPVAEDRGVPYIAPFTGAGLLRDPGLQVVVNLRASYNQETEEMVARLTEDRGFQRIGIVYQDDSYGRAGYNGVLSALVARGMEPAAVGRYTRNTLAVKTAVLELLRGEPQAVIIVGAYQPVAELIKWARHKNLDSVFVNISFVGSNALANALGPDGAGVFVTQVVPFPEDESIPIVSAYHKALEEFDSTGKPDFIDDEFIENREPGFVSLEGYLAGRLAIKALDKCGPDVDRACFLETLSGPELTDLDGFELRFGEDDNQGSDAVFLTVIGPDGRYRPIDSLQEEAR